MLRMHVCVCGCLDNITIIKHSKKLSFACVAGLLIILYCQLYVIIDSQMFYNL